MLSANNLARWLKRKRHLRPGCQSEFSAHTAKWREQTLMHVYSGKCACMHTQEMQCKQNFKFTYLQIASPFPFFLVFFLCFLSSSKCCWELGCCSSCTCCLNGWTEFGWSLKLQLIDTLPTCRRERFLTGMTYCYSFMWWDTFFTLNPPKNSRY